jgi:hypothetical protein
MDSIIEEILEYRKAKLIAREYPCSIPLTDDQKRRLKAWAKSQEQVFVRPDGLERVSLGWKYEYGKIFGMTFTP